MPLISVFTSLFSKLLLILHIFILFEHLASPGSDGLKAHLHHVKESTGDSVSASLCQDELRKSKVGENESVACSCGVIVSGSHVVELGINAARFALPAPPHAVQGWPHNEVTQDR